MKSYAQREEDLRLWKMLGEKSAGVYIDIGCSHWKEDSTTYFFYERGWRGLCVDVQEQYRSGFLIHRPQDVFICAGVSNQVEERVLYDSFGRLSTFVPNHLDKLIEKGVFPKGFAFDVRTVETTTLEKLLSARALPKIDFMSIDVEGFEHQVLLGNDWNRYRPKIILLEATQPCNLSIRTDGPCTDLLQQKGYRPIAFDGLNRYYQDIR